MPNISVSSYYIQAIRWDVSCGFVFYTAVAIPLVNSAVPFLLSAELKSHWKFCIEQQES
jgi:hypothetical protein